MLFSIERNQRQYTFYQLIFTFDVFLAVDNKTINVTPDTTSSSAPQNCIVIQKLMIKETPTMNTVAVVYIDSVPHTLSCS